MHTLGEGQKRAAKGPGRVQRQALALTPALPCQGGEQGLVALLAYCLE